MKKTADKNKLADRTIHANTHTRTRKWNETIESGYAQASNDNNMSHFMTPNSFLGNDFVSN